MDSYQESEKHIVVKKGMRQEVDWVLTRLLGQEGARDTGPTTELHGCELVDRLCSVMEAVLLHGLNTFGFPRDQVLWRFLTRCAPSSVISDIRRQSALTTHAAHCRAYVRDLLNTPGATMGFCTSITVDTFVSQMVKSLYKDWAIIRSEEDITNIMAKLDVLQQSFKLRLRLDHPTLNRWPTLTLRLAGQETVAVPEKHVTPVVVTMVVPEASPPIQQQPRPERCSRENRPSHC